MKSKDITLPTKDRIVKAVAFPVVMYGCESWTIKKAEQWRTDWRIYGFKLWFWRKLLRVPWITISSNQSILKEIKLAYSLEGLMLKFQYLGPWFDDSTHWKRPWCWERQKAEGEEGDREWDGWMASLIQWTWTWANSKRWWGTEKPGVLQPMGSQKVSHDLATEQQFKTCHM